MIYITLKSSEKSAKVLYLALWSTVCNWEGMACRTAAIFSPALDGRPILAERKQRILHPSAGRRTTVRITKLKFNSTVNLKLKILHDEILENTTKF